MGIGMEAGKKLLTVPILRLDATRIASRRADFDSRDTVNYSTYRFIFSKTPVNEVIAVCLTTRK